MERQVRQQRPKCIICLHKAVPYFFIPVLWDASSGELGSREDCTNDSDKYRRRRGQNFSEFIDEKMSKSDKKMRKNRKSKKMSKKFKEITKNMKIK